MNTKNVHIVQKQVIDITLPNANAVFDWEANQRYNITSIIKEQLEKCFDEFDETGKYLIIDRLDMDLGIFKSDTLQSDMSAKLRTELQKKLSHYRTVADKEETISSDLKNNQSSSNNEELTGYLFNDQQGRLEALFFFLKKGLLPWWGSALADWDANWLQQLTAEEISSFKNFLAAADAGILQRIVTQFDDDFIHSLLHRMEIDTDSASAWSWLQEKLKSIFKQDSATSADNVFSPHNKSIRLPAIRLKFWTGWIAHAVNKVPLPDLHTLFDNNISILKEFFFVKEKSADTDFIRAIEAPAIWKEEVKVFRRWMEQNEHSKSMEQSEIEKQFLSTDKLQEEKELQDVTSKRKISIEEEDTMLVNGAGLILLHPFLPQLFRNCGWVNKNHFVNDEAQTLSVYALQYLATGNAKGMEHELSFHKLLVSIPSEEPLAPVEILNDKEKAACDELLLEVLKYWEPLRNTSPDGLREAFLQRTGKLEHINSGWHLTIEQKTIDVLLNRLPWGISLIKFPWMPEMLTVTWQ